MHCWNCSVTCIQNLKLYTFECQFWNNGIIFVYEKSVFIMYLHCSLFSFPVLFLFSRKRFSEEVKTHCNSFVVEKLICT